MTYSVCAKEYFPEADCCPCNPISPKPVAISKPTKLHRLDTDKLIWNEYLQIHQKPNKYFNWLRNNTGR